MKRSGAPERRTPLRRSSPEPGAAPLARSRLKPVSDRRRQENVVRRKVLHERYGDHPRCFLCEPLQAAGIFTGCSGWADDGDEILRRSRGGSIVDPDGIRPVGRLCHYWITDHDKEAVELGLVTPRY